MQCSKCEKVNSLGAQSCVRCSEPLPMPTPPALPKDAQLLDPGMQGGWRPQLTESLGAGSAVSTARAVPSGHIAGTVRGFQSRIESTYSLFLKQQRSWIVWTFQVVRFDAQGNVQERVPVELRGLSFAGAINEGDEVELPRTWSGGATIRPGWVRNRTTGALVTTKGVPASQTFVLAIGIIIAIIIAMAILSEFQQQCAAWRGPNPPPWCATQRR